MPCLPRTASRRDDLVEGNPIEVAEEPREKRDRLLVEIYEELRRLAGHLMRRMPNGTLQPTALVHDAFEKILRSHADLGDLDRAQLLALICTTMRNLLVDHRRAKGRAKRQTPGERLALDDIALAFEEHAVDLVALHEALEELAEFDRQMVLAVDLHFFGGLTLEETALELGIPQRSFDRYWKNTKAWLRGRIG